MRSTAEDLILWKQRIKEKNNSGISVSEWCKINAVSKHKYHYWNNKINKNEKLDNEMEFAEVSTNILNTYEAEAGKSKSDDFQVFFNNVQVTVPSNFNQQSLAVLMKLLHQL